MEKAKNSQAWTEAGYDLFAREGMEGVQIERLARIVGLNKSGFYHHFGDLEGYFAELLKFHAGVANNFLKELNEVRDIDPEFFHLLLRYKLPVMFHMQITRMKTDSPFFKLAAAVHEKQNVIMNEVWCKYLGVDSHSDYAIKYFGLVRDTFYTRVNFQNYTFEFLHELLSGAKNLINQLTEQKSSVNDAV